jgi:hypothetical protein
LFALLLMVLLLLPASTSFAIPEITGVTARISPSVDTLHHDFCSVPRCAMFRHLCASIPLASRL